MTKKEIINLIFEALKKELKNITVVNGRLVYVKGPLQFKYNFATVQPQNLIEQK
jgi:hypothetical protein